MNNFLNAQEELWIGVKDYLEGDDAIEYFLRVKQIVNSLFYFDDMSLSDPNHPCLRFGVHGDNSGNFYRFRDAVWDAIRENIQHEEVITAYRDLLFENSTVVPLTRAMLRLFMRTH